MAFLCFKAHLNSVFIQEIKGFLNHQHLLPMRKPQTILTCMYITQAHVSSGSVWCLNNAHNYLTKPSSACYAQNCTCILHWYQMFITHQNWSRRFSRRPHPGDKKLLQESWRALGMYLPESSAEVCQKGCYGARISKLYIDPAL